MNVHLTYQSGQAYSENLQTINVKVSRPNGKRVRVQFQEQKGKGYASFSLPVAKAQQLAYAILTASHGFGETSPIEFMFDESHPSSNVVAA